MRHLHLEDLKGMSGKELEEHLVDNYAGDVSGFDYGDPGTADKMKLRDILKGFNIIIAYESVGSWGCDSSSFFLLRRKSDGVLFEIHGSHCSCYGFEGQFKLEETTLEYLKSDKLNFCCGGYDDNETANQAKVKKFMAKY